MISLAFVQTWSARALGVALLLQTIELFEIRRALRDESVFSWPVLRREHDALPGLLRGAFAALLPYSRFVALLWMRLAFALLLVAGQTSAAPFLLVSQVAVCVRFRGTFNGGSDHMSIVVLLGVTWAWAWQAYPLAASAGYLYVAVQLVLSYFLAGLAKVREPAWRRGHALASFAADVRYGVPRWARAVMADPYASRPLCWLVLLFECSYPLALTSHLAAAAYLILGLFFHAFNGVVFGLNGFLFAWAAAYPSLLFASAFTGD